MNIRCSIVWLALGLLAAGGCGTMGPTGPAVVTDFDPSAKFSAFHTFAFSGISDRGREVGASDTSPLRNRIKEMVHEQFTAKGIRQVGLEDHPDLLVHLFYGVKDLLRAQGTGMTDNPRWSPDKAYAYHEGTWVPVNPGSGSTTHEQREGTLIVDLAESSKQTLVWRAVIKAVLGDNLEKNFELARKGLARAFKDYPPAAGK
jgi:uncharacterized protein DUF4136